MQRQAPSIYSETIEVVREKRFNHVRQFGQTISAPDTCQLSDDEEEVDELNFEDMLMDDLGGDDDDDLLLPPPPLALNARANAAIYMPMQTPCLYC